MGSGRWYKGFHNSLWYGLCWIFIVSCAAVTIDGQGISQQVHEVTECRYSQFQSTLCSDPGSVIQVRRAVYGDYPSGRWCPGCCPEPDDCSADVQQVDHEYYGEILEKCDGRQRCEGLQANVPQGRAGTCGFADYVTIHYVCQMTAQAVTSMSSANVLTTPPIVTEPAPTPHHDTQATALDITKCRRDSFQSALCTAPGSVVQVQRAVYGDYPSSSWCSGCCPDPGDCFADVQQVDHEYYGEILEKCDGRQRCEGLQVELPRGLAGACGRADYLTIHYTCLRATTSPVPAQSSAVSLPTTTSRAMLLQTEAMHISKCIREEFNSALCSDPGCAIQVQRAVYGDYSSSRWCHECCPEPDDCSADVHQVNPEYYDEILERCNGRQQCEGLQIKVPEGLAGNCGRAEYVTIHYHCILISTPSALHTDSIPTPHVTTTTDNISTPSSPVKDEPSGVSETTTEPDFVTTTKEGIIAENTQVDILTYESTLPGSTAEVAKSTRLAATTVATDSEAHTTPDEIFQTKATIEGSVKDSPTSEYSTTDSTTTELPIDKSFTPTVQHDATRIDYSRIVHEPVVRPFVYSAEDTVARSRTQYPTLSTKRAPNELTGPDDSSSIPADGMEYHMSQSTNTLPVKVQPSTTGLTMVTSESGPLTGTPLEISELLKFSSIAVVLPSVTTQRSGITTPGSTARNTAQPGIGERTTAVHEETVTFQPDTIERIIVSAENTMVPEDTSVKIMGQPGTITQIIVSAEETMIPQDTTVKTMGQTDTIAKITVSAEETMLSQDTTVQTISGPDTTEPTMLPSEATRLLPDTSDTPQVQVNTTEVTMITSDSNNQLEIPSSGSKPTTVPSSTVSPVTEGKKKTPKTAIDTTTVTGRLLVQSDTTTRTVSPSSADANMMQSTIANTAGVLVAKPSSSVASLLPRTPTEGTSMHTSVAPENASEPVTGIPSSSESLNLASTTASTAATSISSSSTKLSTNTPCTNNNCSHMDPTSSADQLTASNDVSDVTDSEHLLNKTDSGPRIDNSAIFIVGLGVAGLLVFCSLVIIIILIYILRKRSAKTYHMNKRIDAAYSNNKRTIRFDNDYFSALGDPGKDNYLLPVEWSNNRSSNDNISKLSTIGENTYEVIPAEDVKGSDDDVYLSTFRAKKKIPLKPAVPLLNHECEINDITVCSP